MNSVSCFAIIVTYNGKKWYDRCIGSLLNSSIFIKVIVIDNKSSDDSVSYIKQKWPKVTVIENAENVGFAAANNIGLKIALKNGGDYFFLLNQDAWVEHDTIETLLKCYSHFNEFGILSPLHLTGDGMHFDKNFLSYLNSGCGRQAIEDFYFSRLEKKVYDVPFVNAAAWLISRKCLETVGCFDTNLFKHYGEDDNYCNRTLYHKFKIGICPTVKVYHDRVNRDKKYYVFDPNSSEKELFVLYSNIRCNKYFYIKHIFNLMINVLHSKNSVHIFLKELIFVIKNIKKIKKSRHIARNTGGWLNDIY